MPLFQWDANGVDPNLQSVRTALPGLSLGSTDQAITWPTPFPDSSYTVTCTIEMGSVNIGSVTPVVKAGSKTGSGCTVTLVNGALVSISAGAVLNTVATL